MFGLFCYCHSLIKSRATCRPKSRCQSDLSTVSVLANRSLHQDLMHSGCRGTAVPNVCLQAFSLFPLPTPLDQRPVHGLSLEGNCELFVDCILSLNEVALSMLSWICSVECPHSVYVFFFEKKVASISSLVWSHGSMAGKGHMA